MTHAKDEDGSEKRSRVISILSKLEDHSYLFTQLKSEARAGGPFDKVKGLIEDMITRLEKGRRGGGRQGLLRQGDVGEQGEAGGAHCLVRQVPSAHREGHGHYRGAQGADQ